MVLDALNAQRASVQVQSMLDTYGAKYHSLKVPRKLQWKPNLGQVTLDVTIGGQALEFQVGCLKRGGGAEP